MRLPGRCVLISKFVPLSSPVIPDVRRARKPKVSGARALRSGIHVSAASVARPWIPAQGRDDGKESNFGFVTLASLPWSVRRVACSTRPVRRPSRNPLAM